MSFPYWPFPGFARGPIAQVQPFSYQDDVTYLDILYKQKEYVNDVLVPHVNTITENVDTALTEQIKLVNDSLSAAIEAVVNNSIEVQDPVVAALVDTPASDSFKSMAALFPVYRVWDGLAYPPRIPGALNIFLGPTFPGLLMAEDDVWEMPNVTTIPEVTSQILMEGSSLNDAVKSVSQQVFIKSASEMYLNSSDPAPLSFIPAGSSSNGTVVRKMRPDGPSRVSTMMEVPRGWKSVKFAVWYTHETPAPAASGIRWQVSVQEVTPSMTIDSTAQWTQASTDTINQPLFVRKITMPTSHILVAKAPVMLRVEVYRNAGHSGDTFVGDASLIALEMWKDS